MLYGSPIYYATLKTWYKMYSTSLKLNIILLHLISREADFWDCLFQNNQKGHENLFFNIKKKHTVHNLGPELILKMLPN